MKTILIRIFSYFYYLKLMLKSIWFSLHTFSNDKIILIYKYIIQLYLCFFNLFLKITKFVWKYTKVNEGIKNWFCAFKNFYTIESIVTLSFLTSFYSNIYAKNLHLIKKKKTVIYDYKCEAYFIKAWFNYKKKHDYLV